MIYYFVVYNYVAFALKKNLENLTLTHQDISVF